MKADGAKIEVRTPNVAGYSRRVDAKKYAQMKAVLLKVIPRRAPGITQSEMMSGAAQLAPRDVFPGSTVNWWVKCVQLDLEARGIVARDHTAKPLRWCRKR